MRWTRFAILCSWLISFGKETGETSQFDRNFVTAAKEILHLWTVEQDHNNSPYRFIRDTDRKGRYSGK